MTNKLILFFFWCVIFSLLFSCKTKEKNYITYYNEVNRIDSIYRIAKQEKIAIKKYKKLFKKFEPKNQERIDEFENYIYLSEKANKNFGGKKSLYKLISLIAPYNDYKKHIPLFQKYGIDSTIVKSEMNNWKNSRNKILMDSINILFARDQENRNDYEITQKNDLKNEKLMKWIFEIYGFPSTQKIGNSFLLTFFSHMSASNSYPYFETRLKEYVKSGECPPMIYTTMVDRYHLQIKKDDILYGSYIGFSENLDSAQIDKNRKSIGLPSLKHNRVITKDFLRKLKENK